MLFPGGARSAEAAAVDEWREFMDAEPSSRAGEAA